MDPVSLTSAAIASLVFSKGLEEASKKLGEKAFESSKKLFDLMKQKYPDVAERESQGELSYREALTQIETAVERDSEVAEVVIDLGQAVKAEPNQDILLQALASVVNITLHETENLRTDSHINNIRIDRIDMGDAEQRRLAMRQQVTRKRDNSMIIGFYFSALSIVLVSLLVFAPLSIGIQQVLVALIALLTVFSFSAFKRATRYTPN